MDYQVSARKYRPSTFDDVIGQGHVVQTLVNSITTKRIAHAFLFSGSRGVGKTTVARILAKALNCERGPTGTPCNTCVNCMDIGQGNSVDVIEIDGASNTSVDDIREVRENVKFAPFRGGYRIYIIDEVHMLSNSAFNALLKTLEEPPGHVVFVFATTEIHKIPPTILSRCQHFNFRRIARSEIIRRLQKVALEEAIVVEERSLGAIARASEGSMRDALSLLDQAVAFGGKEIRHADLETLLGSVPLELVQALVAAVITQDSLGAIRIIADLLDQGHDLRAYCSDVVEYVRNMLVAAVVPSPEGLRGLIEGSDDERDQIRADAKPFTPEQLQELFRIFSQAEDGIRHSPHPRFILELAAVRATRLSRSETSPPAQQPAGRQPATVARGQGSLHSESTGIRATSRVKEENLSEGRGSSEIPGDSAHPGMTEDRARERTRGPRQIPREPPPVDSGSSTQQTVSSRIQSKPFGSSQDAQTRSAPAQESTASGLDWDKVQETVADTHPRLAPFLERGTFVEMDQDVAILGFPKTELGARGIIEKEDNLRILIDLCSELIGRPIRIRVSELTDGQAATPSRAQLRVAQVLNQKKALLEQTRAHPLVKQALHIFGGEVIEVRQASPQQEVPE